MKEEQELNGLPKGWKWAKLKDIAESIQYGFTESASKEKIGPKFLRITDIQENQVVWDNVPYCKIDEESKKKYLLQDGDLVFARTGATVGKSFLIKGEIPESVFASYLIRVRVNQEINEKYLSNFFHSTIYWSQITEGQVGIGQPNVNGTKLGQLDVPLAPKDEQQQIVSKIEELFSELDKGIEELKTAQQQLKIYRQAVLKWAFEGKYSKGADDWKLMKLKEASLKVVVGYVGPITEHVVTMGGIPFLSTTHIGENEFLYHEIREVSNSFNEQNKKSQVIPGDILIARHGDSGKSCIVPDSINVAQVSNAVILRPNPQVVSSKFICYRLNSERQRMQKMKVGGVFQVVNTKSMESFEISIPPLEEQQQIIKGIERRLSVCDKIEETINDSIKQAEALRQSILKQAFEGKLA